MEQIAGCKCRIPFGYENIKYMIDGFGGNVQPLFFNAHADHFGDTKTQMGIMTRSC